MFLRGQLVRFAAEFCSYTKGINVVPPVGGRGVVVQVDGDGDPQISALSSLGLENLTTGVDCVWFLRRALVGKVQVSKLETDSDDPEG